MKRAKVRAMVARWKAVSQATAQAVFAFFPVGRKVKWKHGRHQLTGVVDGHCWVNMHAGDVWVIGDASGKRYRLSIWRLLDGEFGHIPAEDSK